MSCPVVFQKIACDLISVPSAPAQPLQLIGKVSQMDQVSLGATKSSSLNEPSLVPCPVMLTLI